MDTAQRFDSDSIIANGNGHEQYLTFMLAGEEYGVDILRVQEIKGWDNATRIPNTPDYVQGVINLRGTIVPIIDLRMRFNLEKLEYGPTTVVVVLKVESENKHRTMGIVVDGVSDVYSISADELKPAPEFGDDVNAEFVKGLATIDEKMVIMLNIDKLLNSRELSVLDSAASEK
ncbi:Positive regulator of CheA protein activity (CheW) [hydrothermal vent metagenome]|uniref:Chemotaxis protein CheW n=1 Tax=hydrothermal vent metagenome TaxID=652676 RepID=A0A3B1A436_9ZZZZ